MNKISSIKERLLQYLNNQRITKVDFCNKTDISYSNLKGKSLGSEFGGEQIVKILTVFPNINPEWFLLGKGEILRKEGEILSENGENFVVSEKIFRVILEENQKLNREIGRLEAELSAIKKAAAPVGEVAICVAAK